MKFILYIQIYIFLLSRGQYILKYSPVIVVTKITVDFLYIIIKLHNNMFKYIFEKEFIGDFVLYVDGFKGDLTKITEKQIHSLNNGFYDHFKDIKKAKNGFPELKKEVQDYLSSIQIYGKKNPQKTFNQSFYFADSFMEPEIDLYEKKGNIVGGRKIFSQVSECDAFPLSGYFTYNHRTKFKCPIVMDIGYTYKDIPMFIIVRYH